MFHPIHLIQHVWRRRRGKARAEAKADRGQRATRDAYIIGLQSNDEQLERWQTTWNAQILTDNADVSAVKPRLVDDKEGFYILSKHTGDFQNLLQESLWDWKSSSTEFQVSTNQEVLHKHGQAKSQIYTCPCPRSGKRAAQHPLAFASERWYESQQHKTCACWKSVWFIAFFAQGKGSLDQRVWHRLNTVKLPGCQLQHCISLDNVQWCPVIDTWRCCK